MHLALGHLFPEAHSPLVWNFNGLKMPWTDQRTISDGELFHLTACPSEQLSLWLHSFETEEDCLWYSMTFKLRKFVNSDECTEATTWNESLCAETKRNSSIKTSGIRFSFRLPERHNPFTVFESNTSFPLIKLYLHGSIHNVIRCSLSSK